MNMILIAIARGAASMLAPRMLALLTLPFVAALLGWALLAWSVWDPLLAWVDAWFVNSVAPVRWVFAKMAEWGFESARVIATTVLALLVAVPMIFASGMALVAVLAVPVVTRHLGADPYPDVERHGSWSLGASLWNALSSLAIFLVGYLLSLPLWFIPPLAFIVPWLWWSWLTARMMRFDSLVEHASVAERRTLISTYRKQYLLLGLIITVLNYIPPLFLVTPVLSALAYVHYSLALLRRQRATQS